MKTALDKAFEEAAKLPAEEQEALARWLLEELAAEQSWTEKFVGSHDQLSQLAREAVAEYHSGDTEELDPDNL